MKIQFISIIILFLLSTQPDTALAADPITEDRYAEPISDIVGVLMQQEQIPGMSVAIIAGDEQRIYDFGYASLETGTKVTRSTLFEIGTMSRLFSATLAAHAEQEGKLSLFDSVSDVWPALRSSSFDNVTLLNLATHTAGLPSLTPGMVTDEKTLIDYGLHWTPTYPAGLQRTETSFGSGLLGLLAAKSMRLSYSQAMEQHLFPALGMKHSFIAVPRGKHKQVSTGYNRTGAAVEPETGFLTAEALGIKTTASDLLRFVALQMGQESADEAVKQAILNTRVGYFKVEDMIQCLYWEQYPYPVTLNHLLEGNAPFIRFGTLPAQRLKPPFPPRRSVLVNKVGSAKGFSAYIAFVPIRKFGVVLLANKTFPVPARVTAAYQIIEVLERLHQPGSPIDETIRQ
ncbi:serine hydrolase [Nitratireductor indicus]|nr:serine hydrolase [Nitratireductor indicus]SFQ31571.1 beta-lactamase class C [Nitratireductor indicus]